MSQNRKGIRYYLSVIPGTWRDYTLITLAAVDLILNMIRNSYENYLGREISLYIIGFDFAVIFFWFTDIMIRMKKSRTGAIKFLQTYWYEIIGLTPIYVFRAFLLLRAAKLAIAFYKLGRSEQDVSAALTREITFRFRDIIVDTIADAVFLQSLQRVEEVMSKLDYAKLAQRHFKENHDELRDTVVSTLKSKSIMNDLSRIPFLHEFVSKLGDDFTDTIMEVLETEVIGNIIKGITGGVLTEMRERVKLLDLERIATVTKEMTNIEEEDLLESQKTSNTENSAIKQAAGIIEAASQQTEKESVQEMSAAENLSSVKENSAEEEPLKNREGVLENFAQSIRKMKNESRK